MFLDILDEKSPTNIIDWTKLTIEIWSKIVEKMSSDYFGKKELNSFKTSNFS